MSDHEQRTGDWMQARCGMISASRFADVMTNGRGSETWGVTAERYMDELICERLTNQPAKEIKTAAMHWGIEHEPFAREAYEQRTGNTVELTGFIKVQGHLIGGSPDGLVGDDGIIEIKCPMTPQPHLRVIESMQVPDEHFEQIQGYLCITGRHWCDFISYQPTFPEAVRLIVIRMAADVDYHKELCKRLWAFESRLIERMRRLIPLLKGNK